MANSAGEQFARRGRPAQSQPLKIIPINWRTGRVFCVRSPARAFGCAQKYFGDYMSIKHSPLSLALGRRSLQRIKCTLFALILRAALPGLALAKTTAEAPKLPEELSDTLLRDCAVALKSHNAGRGPPA